MALAPLASGMTLSGTSPDVSVVFCLVVEHP